MVLMLIVFDTLVSGLRLSAQPYRSAIRVGELRRTRRAEGKPSMGFAQTDPTSRCDFSDSARGARINELSM
jgi:hypothetical protein